MIRPQTAALLLLAGFSFAAANAQGLYVPPTPVDLSALATKTKVQAAQAAANANATNVTALQTLTGKMCRQLYTSSGTVTVGNNSAARSTMLPAAAAGTSLVIPANALLPGGSLRITGYGLIGATTIGSPMFTMTPHITPAGGSKTDLAGFSAQPLIGVDGMTWLDATITQTTTGLVPAGTVSYAQINSANNYPNPINTARTETASDYTVARTFGVDGKWSLASASNYVTPQMVTIYLCPPGA